MNKRARKLDSTPGLWTPKANYLSSTPHCTGAQSRTSGLYGYIDMDTHMLSYFSAGTFPVYLILMHETCSLFWENYQSKREDLHLQSKRSRDRIEAY